MEETDGRLLKLSNTATTDTNKYEDDEGSPPSLGRFNRKYLPSWAKKQIEDGPDEKGDSQQSPYLPLPSAFLPKGRWAQRLSESGLKPAWEKDLPQRLNIEIKPRTEVFRNNEDDMGSKSLQKRPLINSSSASSGLPQEEEEEITTTDSDACYPQQGVKSSDVKSVKPGVKPKPKVVRRAKPFQNMKMLPSKSVPNINDLCLEDENSEVAKPETKSKARSKFTRNPLYVSSEQLDGPDRSEDVETTRDKLSPEKTPLPVSEKNNLNLLSSMKKNPMAAMKMPSSMLTKPPVSKRREELTKAISEARKKLETIGWKGSGLNNSKSIANLRDINDTAGQVTNINKTSEAVRRSISLSDLSVGNRRIFAAARISADTDESAPLWKLRDVDRNKKPGQEFTPVRSGSSTSLNRPELLNQIKTMPRFRSQGLWGAPVAPRTSGRLSAPPRHFKKSSNCLNGNQDGSGDNSSSSSDTGVRTLRPGTPPKPNILRQIRRSSTSQMIPPKLSNSAQPKTCRKLWDNFALRSTKSDYNLNFVGRDTQPSRVGSSPSSPWGTPEIVFDEKFDLSNTNPATIPLTRELCHHIVDELNQIATYTKKIYHRSAAEGNTALCNILVDGISKAYVNLSTVVNPSSLSNGTLSPNGSGPDAQSDNAAYTMKLLQQYSDKLLTLVEQRMTKEKQNQNA